MSTKHGKRAKRQDLLACSTVTTSGGQTYTVAQLGGGSQLDVESSAYANCDVGIYISATDGPASLNQTVVNGAFEIGVYLDGAGTKINQTSICINGTDENGNCESGSNNSAGTGIYALNTPHLSVNQTNVDGYAAGFATNPCPNNDNDLSVNQSTVTNSTYPWSFQGGHIKANHDSPTPPAGGSCAGSGIGSGQICATTYTNGISPSAFINAGDITSGPDGNLWFTEYNGNGVGKISTSGAVTEYPLGGRYGAGPWGIVTGPDGNLWFTEPSGGSNAGQIGVITTSGSVSEYVSGITPHSSPFGITSGPDGNLWFAENNANQVAKITTSGAVTEYPANGGPYPFAITAGPDGNLWLTYAGATNTSIARVTTGGVVTNFTLLSQGDLGFDTAGPDGNIWFTEIPADKIARITPSGTITEFSNGLSPNAYPVGITSGPDGNLWFTEYSTGKIGRITTAGAITEYSCGIGANSGPYGITSGPDGNIWFVELNGNAIGKLTPPIGGLVKRNGLRRVSKPRPI